MTNMESCLILACVFNMHDMINNFQFGKFNNFQFGKFKNLTSSEAEFTIYTVMLTLEINWGHW